MTNQLKTVVPCPKCKSPETARTGAYNIEARENDAKNVEPIVNVVYDRRCQCGHRFTETVEAQRR